ncbi:GPA2 [Candida pseudojiufengensis]|uniref:GPA2 n=1 Tax=Candida pseudojiufengensis TaxID=497109 RepID=UPI00222549B4|nr:GPA2 [Candida pseudojiufengensis]KAI5966988.1 GPA2 [Candida pseudojiufengensis]
MGSCTSKDNRIEPTSNKSTQNKRQQQTQQISKQQQQNQQQTQQQNQNQRLSSQSKQNSKLEKSNGSTNSQQNQSLQNSLNQNEKQDTEINGTNHHNNNGTVNNNNNELPDTSSDSNSTIKVLLLGSGESGKSTIIKQMKILHTSGYTKEELIEYRPFVYKNVLDCIKNIINAMIEKGNDDLINLNIEEINQILEYEVDLNQLNLHFDQNIAKLINKIYENNNVKNFIIKNQNKFHLLDSTDYLLSDIFRITNPNYIPTTTDILRTRKKTSGIYDHTFNMNGLNIHMFDVGGQRSERKKWIHCFDNVSLIIFCVALSEYDQVLLEENNQNRLEESLALFDSVVNSRWFSRTSVVLFLNKIDIFAEKLQFSPLENYFPDYQGGNNINKAAKYILWRFNQVNRSGLNIYPHVTQATDTKNIELVMAAVKETIMENNLKNSGILS